MTHRRDIDTYSSELREELFQRISTQRTIDQEKEKISDLISTIMNSQSSDHLRHSKMDNSPVMAS